MGTVIWGDLVGIRPLLPADAPALRRFAADPDVADLLFEDQGGPLPTVWALAGMIFVQWFSGRPEYGIISQSGKLIGCVRLWRLSDRNRSAMLTIFIGEKGQWGHGFGTDAMRLALRQAFHVLELRRVELHVFDFNKRAIRCYEKAGFVVEGTRRNALYRRGRWFDILVMGILKDEFLAREAEWKSAVR